MPNPIGQSPIAQSQGLICAYLFGDGLELNAAGACLARDTLVIPVHFSARDTDEIRPENDITVFQVIGYYIATG